MWCECVCVCISYSYSSRTGLLVEKRKEERLSHSQEHVPVSIQEEASMKASYMKATTILFLHIVWTNMDMQHLESDVELHWTFYSSPVCQVWKQASLHGNADLEWARFLRTASSPHQEDCITPVYLKKKRKRKSLFEAFIVTGKHPCPILYFFFFCVCAYMFV